MRFDAGSPERSVFARDFDVCVIGSGPAGLTLARALASQGHQVALMEAGGLEWSPESQDVYAGENLGVDYDLDSARLRFFGGTSYHWNGLSREFDAADFRALPHHPLGAWPIAKDELDPYQAEADAILDVSSPAGPDLPLRQSGDDFRRVHYRFSPPTRFGEKYAADVAAAEGIFLGLNANLVDLRLDAGLGRVTEAVFKSYAAGDPGFTVRARRYCICAGGIENARLLLNFRSQAPAGIGNGHDLVGRHFADHPALLLGEIIFEAPPDAQSQFFVPTEAFRIANTTLGIVLRFNQRMPPATSLGKEVTRSLQCAVPFGARLAEAVLDRRPALCDRGGLGDYVRLQGEGAGLWARIVCNAEQTVNPDSRVRLSEARDAFGMQRVALDWQLTEMDLRTIRLSTLALAQHVAEQNVGRMRLYDWMDSEDPWRAQRGSGRQFGSYHHMCTTRMSDDPRQGVVDRDCRVHGIRNLYLGGSSVFASTGSVNPTYTIVQLALRLGEHIGRELHI